MYFWIKKIKHKKRRFCCGCGGGSNPHWRSDVILEKFYYDDTERGKPLLFDRPLVIADAEQMPFKSKAIDYTICRHVLEHAENAAKFLLELQRVSKAGWIECPTEFDEVTNSKPFHNYVVNQIRGKIILKKKGLEHIKNPLFNKLKRYSLDKHLRNFIIHNLELTTVMLEWKNKIDFRIHKQQKSIARIKARNFLGHEPSEPNVVDKLILKFESVIRHFSSSRRNILEELEKRLCCPHCQGELEFLGGKIYCEKCRLNFKRIAPAIYNFLSDTKLHGK